MKSTGNEHAVELRDMAVKLARTGSSELVVHRVSKARQSLFHALVFRSDERHWPAAEGEQLKIYYRTPFQKLPPISEQAKQVAAAWPTMGASHPYGVAIYYGEKVFEAEWDEGSAIHVTTYKEGAWEAELKQLAS
jgi:hypothetical protein